MTTYSTVKSGQDTSGITTGGFDTAVLRRELQATTHDGQVGSVVIDSMTGRGLATVITVAGTTRYPFSAVNGHLTFRGVTRRFTR